MEHYGTALLGVLTSTNSLGSAALALTLTLMGEISCTQTHVGAS